MDVSLEFVKENGWPSAESAGDRIDDYRLIHPIGEGGGGTVYLAEQLAPVQRHVALKIVKLGMDSRAVINRFEAERQALAMMDHQHIAKVFDAGATPTGRPYFVMELVRGVKITEFCDQHRFSIPERLELFVQICQAIQHAHLKGVIHRDIKPSNVLVAMSDDGPVAKVIDFGVAKAVQGRLTDHTLYTIVDQFIGTPAYVSPEQTDPGARIDTRSDVYSLGVLLYELLTGSTPFSGAASAQLDVEGMRRSIREEQPVPPSRRLNGAHECAARMAARRLEGGRRWSEDLDWIVMRCLEKEPEHRYQSAGALVLDVRRYLGGEPVGARRPSLVYAVSKLARRHRTAFVSGTAVIAVLLIATSIGAWQAMRATRAERLAQHTIDSLVDVFSAADPFVNPNAALSAHALLERAGEAATELARYPDLQVRLLESIGRIYRHRGDLQESKRYLDQVLTMRLQSEDATGEETIDTLFQVAMTDIHLGELQSGAALLAEACRRAEHGGLTNTALYARLSAQRGKTVLYLGDVVAAKRLMETALATNLSVFGVGSMQESVARMYLSELYSWTQDHELAEAYSREGMSIIEANRPANHPDRVIARIRLAEVFQDRRKFDEAERLFVQALQEQKALFGYGSIHVSDVLHEMSKLRRSQGRSAAAEQLARESLRIAEQAKGAEHYATALARAWRATILADLRRWSEAQAEQRRALVTFKAKLPPGHPFIRSSEYALALVLLETNHLDEAEQVLKSSLSHRDNASVPLWRLARARSLLGEVYRRSGRTTEAEPLLMDSYHALATANGADSEERVKARDRLVSLYRDTGRSLEAQVLLNPMNDERRSPMFR